MKKDFAEIQNQLSQVSQRWLPRLLTQVCRDPSAPQFGCFDRDWWHYRIRDFPSIILQQGALALHAAAELPGHAADHEALRELARAGCAFWNRRAQRYGAFEEYYPWEQGYPPLAFSTLAVMKLAAQGVIAPAAVRAGAERACRQLLARFEAQAANQQIAGLAALAWARKNFPDLVSPDLFKAIAERSLALQTPEGWFVEYGGPDLGYLSVTVDCLWDLHDATDDARYLDAIARSIECIDRFTAVTDGESIGMHNARNTDYLVPCGLVRAAIEGRPFSNAAQAILLRLFNNAAAPEHFLAAIDDRYVSHYIGQSLLRAVALLEKAGTSSATGSTPPHRDSRVLTQSGHWLEHTAQHSLIVTCRKGGILTFRSGAGRFSDFGWIVKAGGRQFITHWWSDAWQFREQNGRLVIEGPLWEHKESNVTPIHHFALRVASLLFGYRVIARLKRALIFEKKPALIRFRREITADAQSLSVVDTFLGLPMGAEVVPAPRSSKRHVASADSHHGEDLQGARGCDVQRSRTPQDGTLTITTCCSIPDQAT